MRLVVRQKRERADQYRRELFIIHAIDVANNNNDRMSDKSKYEDSRTTGQETRKT